MRSFSLTKKAKADLKSIAFYTQRKWGKEQRKIYIRQFDDVFHMLADTPAAGNKCNYTKQGYLKFPVTSHLVFYRCIYECKIEIVRILHKRMDAKVQFESP